MTIGVAIYRVHAGGWWNSGPEHAFISVEGKFDTEHGWVDTRGPEIAFGFSWVSELLLVDLGSEWPGYMVSVHWELDTYAHDECERLGLRLPTEVRVPLHPRDTWSGTPVDYRDFDDPWPQLGL